MDQPQRPARSGDRAGNQAEITYFGLQAYMGTTKHMGGQVSTEELAALCRVEAGSHVLDVGCGAGATAVYLAGRIGCRVTSVDMRPAMIDLARVRAEKEGLAGRIECRLADVGDLPFEAGLFDAVLCESVLTFVADKQRAVDELARVVRPGGRVGLNEEIWLQPPPPDLAVTARQVWQIETDLGTAAEWQALLERAGLVAEEIQAHRIDTRREATQVKRYHAADFGRMMWRTLRLYLTSAEFRAYMRQRRRLPRGMFDYLGYGLFVGRK